MRSGLVALKCLHWVRPFHQGTGRMRCFLAPRVCYPGHHWSHYYSEVVRNELLLAEPAHSACVGDCSSDDSQEPSDVGLSCESREADRCNSLPRRSHTAVEEVSRSMFMRHLQHSRQHTACRTQLVKTKHLIMSACPQPCLCL